MAKANWESISRQYARRVLRDRGFNADDITFTMRLAEEATGHMSTRSNGTHYARVTCQGAGEWDVDIMADDPQSTPVTEQEDTDWMRAPRVVFVSGPDAGQPAINPLSTGCRAGECGDCAGPCEHACHYQHGPCATVGHGDRVATHQITYNYRNDAETSTESVCGECAESYSRRPVLANFRATSL